MVLGRGLGKEGGIEVQRTVSSVGEISYRGVRKTDSVSGMWNKRW